MSGSGKPTLWAWRLPVTQTHCSAFASITVRSPTQTFPVSKHPEESPPKAPQSPSDASVVVGVGCMSVEPWRFHGVGNVKILNILPAGGAPHRPCCAADSHW